MVFVAFSKVAQIATGWLHNGFPLLSGTTCNPMKGLMACAGPSHHNMGEPDQLGEARDDRDAAAETELASVVKDDPLAAYDVDVRQEGMAIHEYLRLLQDPK